MILSAFTFDLARIDEQALVITIAGYCIVLLALALLAWIFFRLHTVQDWMVKRRLNNEGQEHHEVETKPAITGEENAAIAAALFLFFSEMHDEEKYVMTIKKVSKTYSPWNSKIYGILPKIK